MEKCVKNLEETKAFALNFSKELKKGDVVILKGDLGAGKTTFTQFVFGFLGVEAVVTSPTFSVLKSYEGKAFRLHHFDCYRINTEEAIECGFDEVLQDSEACIFIEWADKIKELLPTKYISVEIKLLDDETRQFNVSRVE